MLDFEFSNQHGLWLPGQNKLAKHRMSRSAQAEAAKAIREFFDRNSIRVDAQSALGKMISAVERTEAASPDKVITTRDIYDAQTVVHINNALTVLVGHAKRGEYLRKLVSGSLSSYDRGRSVAKDAFWEIDACYQMRLAGLSAELTDHPDITWNHDSSSTGLECKKIHSKARLQNALSAAVGQVSNSTAFGFVVLNIDDFVPGTLRVQRWQDTDHEPQRILESFYAENERHFNKYLRENRISGYLIFCSVRAVIRQQSGRPGFFLTKQWCLYTRPDLPEEHARRAGFLQKAMQDLTRRSY